MFERFESLSLPRQRVILVGLSVLLLFLSMPLNLIFGFLATEEGTTYLRYARDVGTMRAFLAPHQGYYALLPNVVTLLPARWLPLLWAPWLAAWAALAVRAWVAWFVGTCEAIKRGRTRLVLTVLLILAPGTLTAMGTIHSQFYLASAALLILISAAEQFRVSRTVAIVLGGLDGTLTCFLTPFFLYRAWKTRSGTAMLQAAILTVCTTGQLLVIRATLPYTSRNATHLQSAWWYVDAMVNHVLVLPLLSRVVHHELSVMVVESKTGLVMVTAVVFVAFMVAIGFLLWRAGSAARTVLAAGLLSSVCTVVTMEGGHAAMGGGDRYFIVGIAALVVGVALAWERYDVGGTAVHRRAVLVMLGLFCVSSVVEVARYWKKDQMRIHWQDQVAHLRRDPATQFFNGPDFWLTNRYYLAQKPLDLALPFYTFDSSTKPSAKAALPQQWYGPLNEMTTPTSLPETVPPKR